MLSKLFNWKIYILLFFIGLSKPSNSQVFPQDKINKALSSRTEVDFSYPNKIINGSSEISRSGLQRFFEYANPKIEMLNKIVAGSTMHFVNGDNAFATDYNSASLIDTIYVGDVSNDTLIISGTYFNNGPILVFNDGVLIFENASATILGDVFVFQDGKLFCDSSTLNFPQLYFYQRGIIAANNGFVEIKNTTLDYSGLSHSLAVANNAEVILTNINNIGFTTAGGYDHATITIDGSNQAGEFIMKDSSHFSFSNANTILLWHHVPVNGSVDISFPSGSNVPSYNFSNSIPNVSGIGYDVTVNNCTDVMWAFMPAKGSDVTANSSSIRAIGLWFEGSDTVNVSGLVNNSTYTSFTAQIPDRNLQLNNCTLQTWSLYAFDQSVLNISGSVVGEVGSLGSSFITSQGIMCDGSGGYYWGSDTTLNIAISTTVLSSIRSERNGICLLGYGAANSGASAIGSSVMVVTQSSLPQDPVPYENGVAWLVRIDPPLNFYADSMMDVSGSAWIDQGPLGSFMDFGYYSFEYKPAASPNWIVINQMPFEVHNGVLGTWDTQGLTPGAYQLRLNTQNDLGDSIDAVIQVTLLPAIVGVDEMNAGDINFQAYFNHASNCISISIKNPKNETVSLALSDVSGKQIYSDKFVQEKETLINIPAGEFASGLYTVNLKTYKGIISKKLFVKN